MDPGIGKVFLTPADVLATPAELPYKALCSIVLVALVQYSAVAMQFTRACMLAHVL